MSDRPAHSEGLGLGLSQLVKPKEMSGDEYCLERHFVQGISGLFQGFSGDILSIWCCKCLAPPPCRKVLVQQVAVYFIGGGSSKARQESGGLGLALDCQRKFAHATRMRSCNCPGRGAALACWSNLGEWGKNFPNFRMNMDIKAFLLYQ